MTHFRSLKPGQQLAIPGDDGEVAVVVVVVSVKRHRVELAVSSDKGEARRMAEASGLCKGDSQQ